MKRLLRRMSFGGGGAGAGGAGAGAAAGGRHGAGAMATGPVFGTTIAQQLRDDAVRYPAAAAADAAAAGPIAPVHFLPEIPIILQSLVRFLAQEAVLRVEGLFRVSGFVRAVRDLRQALETGAAAAAAAAADADAAPLGVLAVPFQPVLARLDPQDPADVHAAAALLKQWLRELEDGVVPKQYHAMLVRAAGADAGAPADAQGGDNDGEPLSKSSLRATAAQLKAVLDELPRPNRRVLLYLCRFLRRVASRAAENRMSVANLVVVFAPNLMRVPSDPATGGLYVAESLQTNAVLLAILDHLDALDPPGGFPGCAEVRDSAASLAAAAAAAAASAASEAGAGEATAFDGPTQSRSSMAHGASSSIHGSSRSSSRLLQAAGAPLVAPPRGPGRRSGESLGGDLVVIDDPEPLMDHVPRTPSAAAFTATITTVAGGSTSSTHHGGGDGDGGFGSTTTTAASKLNAPGSRRASLMPSTVASMRYRHDRMASTGSSGGELSSPSSSAPSVHSVAHIEDDAERDAAVHDEDDEDEDEDEDEDDEALDTATRDSDASPLSLSTTSHRSATPVSVVASMSEATGTFTSYSASEAPSSPSHGGGGVGVDRPAEDGDHDNDDDDATSRSSAGSDPSPRSARDAPHEETDLPPELVQRTTIHLEVDTASPHLYRATADPAAEAGREADLSAARRSAAVGTPAALPGARRSSVAAAVVAPSLSAHVSTSGTSSGGTQLPSRPRAGSLGGPVQRLSLAGTPPVAAAGAGGLPPVDARSALPAPGSRLAATAATPARRVHFSATIATFQSCEAVGDRSDTTSDEDGDDDDDDDGDRRPNADANDDDDDDDEAAWSGSTRHSARGLPDIRQTERAPDPVPMAAFSPPPPEPQLTQYENDDDDDDDSDDAVAEAVGEPEASDGVVYRPLTVATAAPSAAPRLETRRPSAGAGPAALLDARARHRAIMTRVPRPHDGRVPGTPYPAAATRSAAPAHDPAAADGDSNDAADSDAAEWVARSQVAEAPVVTRQAAPSARSRPAAPAISISIPAPAPARASAGLPTSAAPLAVATAETPTAAWRTPRERPAGDAAEVAAMRREFRQLHAQLKLAVASGTTEDPAVVAVYRRYKALRDVLRPRKDGAGAPATPASAAPWTALVTATPGSESAHGVGVGLAARGPASPAELRQIKHTLKVNLAAAARADDQAEVKRLYAVYREIKQQLEAAAGPTTAPTPTTSAMDAAPRSPAYVAQRRSSQAASAHRAAVPRSLGSASASGTVSAPAVVASAPSAEIAALLAEKKALHAALRGYRDAFMASHEGRAPRTREERAPIEAVYTRYLTLRTQLSGVDAFHTVSP
ncbi:hypothetical protein CXG81DRAFT_27422 [Caulochytrium protostelioides]|uniref:Rho-GAP domain-containing protein n=1 Tax=Caulochytrium protostelioides TaxID=1555241 RepID=A0A4P9X481_9FUNG|nr:hypothetical protein CXG81DRAFT_27422 [Caulochytrium protostelioides]|eukprot:RKO99854.1 hypothetical protein CXG81DRAFT_27422 [Caulochytrium protostelioides]